MSNIFQEGETRPGRSPQPRPTAGARASKKGVSKPWATPRAHPSMPAEVIGSILPRGADGFVQGPVCPGRQEHADAIDRAIALELHENCERLRGAVVTKFHAGVYEINGRRVRIEMAGGNLALVVCDGPLRQGFVAYVAGTLGRGDDDPSHPCHYAPPPDSAGPSALCSLPKEQRLTFNEPLATLDRFAAMCCASKQAKLREEHAQVMSARARPPAPYSVTPTVTRSGGAPWTPPAVGTIWSPAKVTQPFDNSSTFNRCGSATAAADAAHSENAHHAPSSLSHNSNQANRVGNVHYC